MHQTFKISQAFDQIPSSMLNPIMGIRYLLTSQLSRQLQRIYNKQINYFQISIMSTHSAIETEIFMHKLVNLTRIYVKKTKGGVF